MRSKSAEYQQTGVLPERELIARKLVPSRSRLDAGPVVVVECIEQIPCDPCAHACPRSAITVGPNLTDTPRVDFDKCNGCAICVARCPGLAIFVVNRAYSETEATVTLPYEMLPRPTEGSRVTLLDRAGRPVGRGRVVRMRDTKVQDRCAVVTVTVPKRLLNAVRGIRVSGRKGA
ncbi:MAG: 4Fe-4S binding protein [candidate division WOR-3 bacterium]